MSGGLDTSASCWNGETSYVYLSRSVKEFESQNYNSCLRCSFVLKTYDDEPVMCHVTTLLPLGSVSKPGNLISKKKNIICLFEYIFPYDSI